MRGGREREEGISRETFKSPWWMALRFLSLFVVSLRIQNDLHVLLVTREWCFPFLFLTRGFVNRLRPSHYKQLSTPGPSRRPGPKCADASEISKWCICTTRWILSVELMIIPGRDRCCQKVTRRQGNGLQPAAHGLTRGEEKKKNPEEDGESQREDNQNGKKEENLNMFKPHQTLLPQRYKSQFFKSDENVINIYFKIFFLALHCYSGTSLVTFRG